MTTGYDGPVSLTTMVVVSFFFLQQQPNLLTQHIVMQMMIKQEKIGATIAAIKLTIDCSRVWFSHLFEMQYKPSGQKELDEQ